MRVPRDYPLPCQGGAVLTRPTFRPSFHVEAIEGEGVYLISERGRYVLRAELYGDLAPLLDGQHSVDEVVDTLADRASAAEVYHALASLERHGYVVEAVDL